MSKKNDQLWNNSFDDSKENAAKVSDSPASRSQYQKKRRRSSLLVWILSGIIAVLAIGSIATYMTQRGSFNTASKSESSVAISSKKSSVSKKSESKKKDDSQKKSSNSETDKSKDTNKESNSSSLSSSSIESSSVQSEASESTQAASSQGNDGQTGNGQADAASTTSTTGNGQYATVQAGQGLYRVAVNNGISVQELLQLNGLSSGSDIQPGQQLRVR